MDIFSVKRRGGEDAGGVVQWVRTHEQAQARGLEARPAGGAGKWWDEHGELHMFESRSFVYQRGSFTELQWPVGAAQRVMVGCRGLVACFGLSTRKSSLPACLPRLIRRQSQPYELPTAMRCRPQPAPLHTSSTDCTYVN